jgi:hypothetical protein
MVKTESKHNSVILYNKGDFKPWFRDTRQAYKKKIKKFEKTIFYILRILNRYISR